MLFFIACQSHENNEVSTQMHHDESHQEEHSAHSANDFMHQQSVEELAKRFDSQERDAYQKPNEVLDYLGDLNGKTVIDIGAGSGYFAIKMAQQGASVIAADVNEEFLAIVQSKIKTQNLSNVEVRKVPFDSPNLNDAEVDIALIVNTYHHIENRTEYFKKVKQGTKDEGRLVVIDFFKSDVPVGPPTKHKLSIDEVLYELKQAGYGSFSVEVDLLPYQYIITARK